MRLSFWVVFGLSLGFVFLPRPACAQLLIEQGKVEATVEGGESLVDSVVIHNTSDQEIPVKVYWQDFNYIAPYDGKKEFLPSGSTSYTLSTWVSFSPQEFVLAPFSKRQVTYTIKVPANVVGGHYGVLFFEKGEIGKTDEKAVRLIARVGCLFFLEAKNKSKAAVVDQLTVLGTSLTGSYQNKGDVIVLPQGIYYIMDKEGLVVDRGEMLRLYVPPGHTANFSTNFASKLLDGEYTLVLTFDQGQGDTLVKEVDFSKVGETSKLLAVRD